MIINIIVIIIFFRPRKEVDPPLESYITASHGSGQFVNSSLTNFLRSSICLLTCFNTNALPFNLFFHFSYCTISTLSLTFSSFYLLDNFFVYTSSTQTSHFVVTFNRCLLCFFCCCRIKTHKLRLITCSICCLT